MTAIDRNATVAQIVAEHAAAARVFQKHRIDFCCHGDVSLAEACRERHLDPEVVATELERAIPGEPEREDPRALPVAALVARIVDHHHTYLRRALPAIGPLLAKVAGVHGAKNSRLRELKVAFAELADTIEPHLEEEEHVLFPALIARTPDVDAARRGLERMYREHEDVGRALAEIRSLADGFAVPEWGCTSYQALMAQLEALESDLLRHVHLEDHVLMPRFRRHPEATC